MSEAGEIARRDLIEAANRFYGFITLRKSVIMPNHVHFRFTWSAGNPNALKDIGKFVGRFKQLSQYHIAGHGPHVWQDGYHDILCVSERCNRTIDAYIANNPLKWWLMYCDKSLMHVEEPFYLPQGVDGSFDSEDAEFDPERNSLYVGATLSQSLRDRVAGIVPDSSGESAGGTVKMDRIYRSGRRPEGNVQGAPRLARTRSDGSAHGRDAHGHARRGDPRARAGTRHLEGVSERTRGRGGQVPERRHGRDARGRAPRRGHGDGTQWAGIAAQAGLAGWVKPVVNASGASAEIRLTRKA